jgi:hypothetical protein
MKPTNKKLLEAAEAGNFQCPDIRLVENSIEVTIGCSCERLKKLIAELNRIGLRLPSHNCTLKPMRNSIKACLTQIGFKLQPDTGKVMVYRISVVSLRGQKN